MKIRIVPHGPDCQHDTAVMHGDTLLICETMTTPTPARPDADERGER